MGATEASWLFYTNKVRPSSLPGSSQAITPSSSVVFGRLASRTAEAINGGVTLREFVPPDRNVAAFIDAGTLYYF